MQPLAEFRPKKQIEFLFTDIDGTLTVDGRLPAESYASLWAFHNKKTLVIPITGRPAGWCEMIARLWPVDAVVGENGAFYFRYKNQKMFRHFVVDEETRLKNQQKLQKLRHEILTKVPGSAISSDQFTRLFDLAVDFCEDVPRLPKTAIDKIVELFEDAGAVAKVSSIHVNGWFGAYDKLSMCREYLRREHGLELDDIQDACAFAGDSPNDEPLFAGFRNSFAMANIGEFLDDLEHKPAYITSQPEGHGFVELQQHLQKV